MINEKLYEILEHMKSIEEEQVVETPEEPEVKAFDYVDHNSGSSVEVVSAVAYLLGVKESYFRNPGVTLDEGIFDRLEKDRNARILRQLSVFRTSVMRNSKKIYDLVQAGSSPLSAIRENAYGSVEALEKEEVTVLDPKLGFDARRYVLSVNRIMKDRVNNVRPLFPSFVEWSYIKELFVSDDSLDYHKVKGEIEKFHKTYRWYPFNMYFQWKTPEDKGNILVADKRFVPFLYSLHGKTFGREELLVKVSDEEKGSISSFVDGARRLAVVVDCENSEVFRVFSLLSTLEETSGGKVERILLVDDKDSTSDVWKGFASYTSIPVERIEVERVKGEKSRLDQALCVKLTKVHYRDDVDSFILVASDSDYLTLIEQLEDARFYVMGEREKLGGEYRKKLAEHGVEVSWLNNFNGQKSSAIRRSFIYSFLNDRLHETIVANTKSLLTGILREQHMELSSEEYFQVLGEIEGNLRTLVGDNGDVRLACGL